MTEHIWPLLRLDANNEEELVEAYRRVYIENYVKTADGKNIELYDWHGNRIIFRAVAFDHAFSESTDYRFGRGIHDIAFSKKRARFMLWIKEVLSATKGNIERRHQSRKDSRGRLKKRRILIVIEEQYVVVLEERKCPKEFEFITAFLADKQYLHKIRKESSLMEIKNPSLNGD
jgi:hypothetical protein